MRWEVLTELQRGVAERVLQEESRKRRHLAISLSGAHAYGFPSPDSDLDIKGIHVDPTRKLLALRGAASHDSRLETLDGVEVDYSSNELHPVLVGILGGNGNYIERVLGSLILHTSPEHEALRPLVQRSLSRQVYRHYQGFATSQLRAFEEAKTASAKRVLYVLRTTLTGTHLLRTGEVVTDVTLLLAHYGFGHAEELIAIKREGERTSLAEPVRARWAMELARAFATLDEARAASSLPEEPQNQAEIEGWLLDVRRAFWG